MNEHFSLDFGALLYQLQLIESEFAGKYNAHKTNVLAVVGAN